jgi:hypothetical protein
VASGTGTITDDGTGPDGDDPLTTIDDDRPVMSIGNVSVEEGSSAVFAVTLSTAAEAAYDVTFTTGVTGSAEAGDITTPLVVKDSSGNVIADNGGGVYTVPVGETSLTVAVSTVDEDVYEGAETFELNGSTEFTPATIATGTGTILDDGSAPDGDDPDGISDDDRLSLDLDANNDNDSSNTVNYQTIFIKNGAGVTLGDSDVDLITGTNVTTVTLSVAGVVDAAEEKIIIDGTTYALNANSGVADTAGGTYQVTVSASGATFVITKAGGGTLSEAEVESLLNTDMVYRNTAATPTDGDRTINIVASDGTNNASTTATVTIGNELTVSDPAAVDEGKSAVFFIDLNDVRAIDTVLDLSIGGDVTAVSDYDTALYYKDIAPDGQSWSWALATGSQVTITAGDTRVEVKVATLSDVVSDNAEVMTLTANINGYAETDMANTSDTGTTTVNDYPTLRVGAPNYVSEGNAAIFEVGLSSVKIDDTVVNLSLGGEAVAADYNAVYECSTDDGTTWANVVGNQITILGDANANNSVLVRVTTIDDGTPEGDELLTLVATTNDPVVATSGIANAGANISGSTVIVDTVSLTVSEEKDGVAIIGTTTADTIADVDYSYTVLGQGTNGTVTDNGDGTLRYTPDTDFSGTDSFVFTKTDITGNTTTAEAVITVAAVADTPNITLSVNNSVIVVGSNQATNPDFDGPVSVDNGVDGNWYGKESPGASGKSILLSKNVVLVLSDDGSGTSSQVDLTGEWLVQNVNIPLANDAVTYEVTFTITGVGTDGAVSWMGDISDGATETVVATGLAAGTHTISILSTVTIGSDVTDNALVISGNNISVDNIVLVSSENDVIYDVNVLAAVSDTTNDTGAAPVEYEFIQDSVTISGVPNGAVFSNASGIVGVLTTAGATDTWAFTQAELNGLQIKVAEADTTTGFTMTVTTTAEENVGGSTATSSTSVTILSTNDVPLIGNNTLIMANEALFNGSVTDTVDTYFSTDGGNTFSWSPATSTLPNIYSEGQLVAIAYDDATGTVTGTIDGGLTTVFTVTVNMQDANSTDITYDQPNSLLGIMEVFDGGIVLPGGGNSDTIVLGFNDGEGNASGVDAIIVAHNLIEDTYNEINEILEGIGAEHTVNTNNYYIGVDSNNMNPGQQLIMDFATVASDGSGNTSHANEVAEMDISLFNFGSVKSGDELYITVVTGTQAAPVRETIVLIGDPDLTSLKYTVKAPSGDAFHAVEFLAGNESSFKLGIESISSINYNTDFDMNLSYAITDVDGDSDSGSVLISLDGDESVIYDSTKTAIDAGDEQSAALPGDDYLVFNAGDGIDFSALDNPVISNFEVIDLTNNADNVDTGALAVHSITNLSLSDVIAMTDTDNVLKILGDGLDNVTFDVPIDWTKGAAALDPDGHTYVTYTNGASTLLIEDTITNVI